MMSDRNTRNGSGEKILSDPEHHYFKIANKVLYFQNFGQTNKYVVEVFLKWSDQSRTPSVTPET